MAISINQKTESDLHVRVEGSNEIILDELTSFLTNVSKMFNLITNKSDKEAFLKLKVKAVEKGSFTFTLSTLVEYSYTFLPIILEPLNATTILNIFFELIELRKNIGNDAIKYINKNEIGKLNGDVINISNLNVGTINIINDKEIFKKSMNFTDNIKKSINNRNFELSNNANKLSIDEDYRKNTENEFEILDEIENKVYERKHRVSVTLKKPDLEMKSKWQILVFGSLKDVLISDENFKNKVLSGEFKARNKQELNVNMIEKYIVNKNGEDEIKEYVITEVIEYSK